MGAIKPEPEIYNWIVVATGIPPKQTLFVGDTYLADYKGPTRFGFQSRHLVRNEKSHGHKISSLTDILKIL